MPITLVDDPGLFLYEGYDQSLPLVFNLNQELEIAVDVTLAVSGALTASDFESLTVTIPTGVTSLSTGIAVADDAIAEFPKVGQVSVVRHPWW